MRTRAYKLSRRKTGAPGGSVSTVSDSWSWGPECEPHAGCWEGDEGWEGGREGEDRKLERRGQVPHLTVQPPHTDSPCLRMNSHLFELLQQGFPLFAAEYILMRTSTSAKSPHTWQRGTSPVGSTFSHFSPCHWQHHDRIRPHLSPDHFNSF